MKRKKHKIVTTEKCSCGSSLYVENAYETKNKENTIEIICKDSGIVLKEIH